MRGNSLVGCIERVEIGDSVVHESKGEGEEEHAARGDGGGGGGEEEAGSGRRSEMPAVEVFCARAWVLESRRAGPLNGGKGRARRNSGSTQWAWSVSRCLYTCSRCTLSPPV